MDFPDFSHGTHQELTALGLYFHPGAPSEAVQRTIARTLRPTDVAEARTFFPTCVEAVLTAFKSARWGGVLYDMQTKEPVAAIGVGGEYQIARSGRKNAPTFSAVWFFGTSRIDEIMFGNKRAALRVARRIVSQLYRRFGPLGNVVPTTLWSARGPLLIHLGRRPGVRSTRCRPAFTASGITIRDTIQCVLFRYGD